MKRLFLLITLLPVSVFAQSASPSPVPKIIDALTKVDSSIPVGNATLVVALGFIVDFLMRLVPTAQPRSVFYLIASLFDLLGSIFTKVGKVLDGVVQNLQSENKP
jgi:hypothetical protein